jgi:hypothetical protein
MKLAKGFIFCFVAFWLESAAPENSAFAAAKTRYVDASMSQSGDGTSSQKGVTSQLFPPLFWWYEATVPSSGTLTTWTGSTMTIPRNFYEVELR